MRSCYKPLLYLMEPMPAGSRTDLLVVVKAEPSSDGCSASGVTLSKGDGKPGQQQLEERNESM